MTKLPTVDIVDGELWAGTTFSFDMRFWIDKEKTQPHDVESFKCVIYTDGGDEIFDVGEHATVDEDEANVVHVSVPGDATEDLQTDNTAQWQGITTFVDGEVRPAFKGKMPIWGKKAEDDA